MNKFLIPAILVATVMVAGIFAFMPIEKASTVHGTILLNAGGSSAILTKSVTTLDLNQEDIFHHFTLISEKPYTIHDIQVKAEIQDNNPPCDDDRIRVDIEGYPRVFNNHTLADFDGATERLLRSGNPTTILDGNDDVNPQIWSDSVEDRNRHNGPNQFTQDTNIVLEIEFEEGCEGTADFFADVTFYLKGITEDDAVLRVDEDHPEFDVEE